jgi:hypothetical protein
MIIAIIAIIAFGDLTFPSFNKVSAMVEFEFLGNGAEETGIWDDRHLPLSNMDLLQKVEWHLGPDGKAVLEMDAAVAKLLSRKMPAVEPEVTTPFDQSKRFLT